jgi:hypothetical protein
MEPFGVAPWEGFMTFEALRAAAYRDVPTHPGVYQVLLPTTAKPIFLRKSPAGRFKGRDPTVPLETLNRRWIGDAACLYIGKAGGLGQQPTLRSRISQLGRFGAGEPVAHWGGRYLWQLGHAESLVVCWAHMPKEEPPMVERKLLCQFLSKYDGPPFANVRVPHCERYTEYALLRRSTI